MLRLAEELDEGVEGEGPDMKVRTLEVCDEASERTIAALRAAAV